MTTEANPYQTPNTADELAGDDFVSPPRSRFTTLCIAAAWLLACLYPVWLLGSFYLTWLLAWWQLGHRPRPMLDDPKSIGGIVNIAYFVSYMLVMLMPILAPAGLAASFFCPLTTRRDLRPALRTALPILYVVLCGVVVLILRSDPAGVVNWWFD